MNKLPKKLHAVSLRDAVLCADCETISNSAQHECLVCGSRSLVNFARMLGKNNSSQIRQADQSKHNVTICLNVDGLAVREINDVISWLSRLVESSADAICHTFHIQIEPAIEHAEAGAGKAA